MIMRVIASVTSIALCLCLLPAFAGAGHTIRNGGGDGELEFIAIWSTLDRRLKPCLHPQSPCRLNAAERGRLATLIGAHDSARPPQFDKSILYTENGQPRGHAEILTLAVDLLQTQCEQLLAPKIDSAKLVQRLLAVQLFRVLDTPGGEIAVTATNNTITIVKEGAALDLSRLISDKLGILIGDLRFARAEFRIGKIEVHAMINGASVLAVLDTSLDPKTAFIFVQ